MASTLAIAIPCYNRPEWLKFCVASIFNEAGAYADRVSIFISDNSEDSSSEQAICAYMDGAPRIHYHQNIKNIGALANMLQVVEQADADYVWMMGDDDWILPGGIARVFAELDGSDPPNGLVVNSAVYYNDAITIKLPLNADLAARNGNRSRRYASGSEAMAAFSLHIGFISVLIIRKKLWIDEFQASVGRDISPEYTHACVYGRAVVLHGNWHYVNEPCMAARGETDSWMAAGRYLQRLDVLVRGGRSFLKVVPWPDQAVRGAIGRHVCGYFAGASIRWFLRSGAGVGFRLGALALCAKNYWLVPEFYLKLMPSLLLPKSMLDILQKRRLAELNRQ